MTIPMEIIKLRALPIEIVDNPNLKMDDKGELTFPVSWLTIISDKVFNLDNKFSLKGAGGNVLLVEVEKLDTGVEVVHFEYNPGD